MTPMQEVLQHYRLPTHLHGSPFKVHPLQGAAVDTLAPLMNAGVFLDVGTGKTLVQTLISLHRRLSRDIGTSIVIMPPLLVPQWGAWLARVTHADGRPLRVVEYQGPPKARAALSLDADFILVGIQIFKRDYDRFFSHFSGQIYEVAIDEANMLSNVSTDNHKKVYEFAAGMPQSLLTGTPINDPMDAYGILKFTNPGAYRSLRMFENLHVAERDFFKNPIRFDNLELLAENMRANAARVLFEDMYPDAEHPLFVPMPYDLDSAHLKLYRRIAELQLLELEGGDIIDLTQSTKLLHALGQIVVNYGHFSGDDGNVSTALDMVMARLTELGAGKLVVFSNYRMSVSQIAGHARRQGVDAVTINGDSTRTQKQASVDAFIQDPAVRLAVINPKSGGAGLDGLQHVCHHMMFLEPVTSPRDFAQCVARLKRTGQTLKVVVALPIARGTLQVRAQNSLIENDTVAKKVVRGVGDLRELIFGG
jgi:SNF2 family DNA or RNA helicase